MFFMSRMIEEEVKDKISVRAREGENCEDIESKRDSNLRFQKGT